VTAWQDSTRRDRFPSNWARIRQQILERDGHRCQWVDQLGQCGQIATDVDHIRPVSQGGTDAPQNLTSLCRWHHNRKSSAEGNAARWQHRDARPAERHPGLL
jgi:5-methylcytosine-specific restriction endonuclease McrA